MLATLGIIQSNAKFTGLLDTYSGAAAAYSLRKLRNAYSGSAIRVRRSSDNTEQDIGFDGNGNLNESALTSFVGANSGYVTKWYDQSGNGIDMSQSTQAYQPRIVNGGVIIKQNNKVVVYFDGSSYILKSSSNILNTSPITFTAAFGQTTSGGDFLGNRGSSQGGWIYRLHLLFGNIGNNNATISSGQTTKHVVFGIRDSNGANTFWINSTIQSTTSGNVYTQTSPSGVFGLGCDGNSSGKGVGYLHEFIGWEINQTSNKSSIESNINSYYSIY